MVLENCPSSILPGGVTRIVGFQEPPAKVRARAEANAARRYRKRVEQKLDAIQQKLAEPPNRARASPRSLTPAQHNVVQVLKSMPPGELVSLQVREIVRRAQVEIDAKYGGVGRSRSTIMDGRTYLQTGKWPPRRRFPQQR
jgi:hypothetical protein